MENKVTKQELFEIFDQIGKQNMGKDGSIEFVRDYKNYVHSENRPWIMTNSPFEYMCIGVYSYFNMKGLILRNTDQETKDGQ